MEDLYEAIVRVRQEGRRAALATIVGVKGSVPSRGTAKMLFLDDGRTIGTIGGGCVEADVWQAAKEIMDTEESRTLAFNLNESPKYDSGLVCGGSLTIFVEPLVPPARLYLFGAGHVGLSVYRAARLAELEVVVIDDRESFANRERFPEARELFSDDFEKSMPRLAPPPNSAIVVATRGHHYDMNVLRWAVTTQARYIGMLGSRRKVLTIYRELEKSGVPAEVLARVRAPIGLEIGSVTPGEIAISIVAEVIAARRGAELGRSRKPRAPVESEAGPVAVSVG